MPDPKKVDMAARKLIWLQEIDIAATVGKWTNREKE
jgi:hypothetical protein